MTEKHRQVKLFASPVKFAGPVEFASTVEGINQPDPGSVGPFLGVYRRQSGFYLELKAHPNLDRTGNRDVTILVAGWYMRNNRVPTERTVGEVVRLTGRNTFITGPWE